MRRGVIAEWMAEQRDKHVCKCGCGGIIEIRPYHHWQGIPKYIATHARKGGRKRDEIITRWVENNQGKHRCACGCGGEIPIDRADYKNGARKYLYHHQPSGMVGKRHSIQTKERISTSLKAIPNFNKFKSEEHRLRISKSMTGRVQSDESKQKKSIALLGRKHCPERVAARVAKQKVSMRSKWQDPNYVKKQIVARNRTKPNKLERRFINLSDREGWGLQFVGGGDLVVGGRCPDFVDGRRNIVEIFGDYWHKEDDPTAKILHYKKHGYRCLVVWEKEFRDENAVMQKIKRFLRGKRH